MPTISPEMKAQVVKMRGEGYTVREISTKLAIGKSSVSDIMKAQAPAITPDKTLSEPVTEQQPMASPAEINSFLSDISPPAAAPAKGAMETNAFLDSFAAKMAPAAKYDLPDAEPEPKPRKARGKPKRSPEMLIEEVDQAAPPPPPPPPPAPELPKGELIAKITGLVTNYGPILQQHVKDSASFVEKLPSRSQGDLKTTLELLEATKTIHNSSQALHLLFGGFAGGVELFGSKVLRLKTEGYQALLLSQDQALKDIFRDIAYENVNSLKKIQRPELRLGLLMVQTLMLTDARNRASAKASDSPAGPETVANDTKYGDL